MLAGSFKRLVIASALGLCFQHAVALEVDDAVAVVGRLHAALLEVAAIEPAEDLATRYAALAPVVRETHDLTTMGRLTVRRFWRTWSEAERESFLEAFEALSITTYASRFASIGPDTFGISGGEQVSDNRVEVRAVIHRRDADDVSMDYTLQPVDGHWRIVNIIADGASELSLMAAKYYDILESGNFDDLIAELEAETAEL